MEYMKISPVLRDLAEKLETGNLPESILTYFGNHGLSASHNAGPGLDDYGYIEFRFNGGNPEAVRRYLKTRDYPFQESFVPRGGAISTAFWLAPCTPTKNGYTGFNPYYHQIKPPEGREGEWPDLWFYLTTGVSIEKEPYASLHVDVLRESLSDPSVQEEADKIIEAFLPEKPDEIKQS